MENRYNNVKDVEKKKRYHPVVCSETEETAERYDGRDAGEVEEDDGGEALDVEPVRDVREVERVTGLHVVNQPSEQPGSSNRYSQ